MGGGGGGDEKVGMALLGWDSLLQGGIQSRLTPTHHFDFEDAASKATPSHPLVSGPPPASI